MGSPGAARYTHPSFQPASPTYAAINRAGQLVGGDRERVGRRHAPAKRLLPVQGTSGLSPTELSIYPSHPCISVPPLAYAPYVPNAQSFPKIMTLFLGCAGVYLVTREYNRSADAISPLGQPLTLHSPVSVEAILVDFLRAQEAQRLRNKKKKEAYKNKQRAKKEGETE